VILGPCVETTLPIPAGQSRIQIVPSPPIRLGRYTIVKLLGSGGMGAVFRGHDCELDRGVAIKVLRRDRDAEELTEALRREAQALARLAHPNVVTVYDVGFDQGQLFVVMQLIDGESIDRWLRACAASPAQIVAAFRDAGRGLAAAHASNLVHCDFKPGNVLVDRDGVVRVSDFGLARIGAETAIALAGTPRYMAPEQFSGVATAASDQYSFCVALWEVLAGEPPFPDAPLDDKACARARPTMPRSARTSGYVVRALLRGLSHDPDDRFPSMEMLLEALEAPAPSRRWAIGGVVGGTATAVAVLATFALAAPASAVRTPAESAGLAPPIVGAPRAITHYGWPVSADEPALDGDNIVFSRSEEDAVDLYTVPLAGGTPRQLTSTPSWEWRANPGRHPGEVIHLIQNSSTNLDSKVGFLDTATGRETIAATVITPDAAATDDGIVYVSADRTALRELARGQDIVLAHAPAGHLFHFLAMSHHRDRVAAIVESRSGNQLCIVDVQTGTNDCARANALPSHPAFGFEDRALYYDALDGIHRHVLATADDTLIVPGVVSDGGLAITDDGRALAYSNCEATQQLVDWNLQHALVDDPDAGSPTGTTTDHLVWVRWLRDHSVLVADVDGTPTQLTEPEFGPISEPAMSPDGNVVAFRSGPPHPGIYAMNLRSGSRVQEISGDVHDSHPVWLGPDQLAFTRAGDDGIPTVFTAASDGAMPRPIATGRTAIGGREHRLLVATRFKLYWIDLVSGRERPGPERNPSASTNASLVMSPDGRWLVMESGIQGQRLERMRLDPPGPVEPLAPMAVGQTIVGKPSITNDGHVVVAPARWAGNVYIVPATSGSRF